MTLVTALATADAIGRGGRFVPAEVISMTDLLNHLWAAVDPH